MTTDLDGQHPADSWRIAELKRLGKENGYCWRCKGSGELPAPFNVFRAPVTQLCPVCDGSGEVQE